MLRIAPIAFAALIACSTSVAALTIDTNPTYDGSINDGWLSSGQSLTVDALESRLDDISFYFDGESSGLNFDFTITDAFIGGNTLFSTSFSVLTGINTFVTNLNLTPGATIFALFDYNGFSGKTAHFSYTDGYAGGHSYFNDDETFTGLDHRFIANFSSPAAVPLPATGLALIAGLGGLAAMRRRKGLAA